GDGDCGGAGVAIAPSSAGVRLWLPVPDAVDAALWVDADCGRLAEHGGLADESGIPGGIDWLADLVVRVDVATVCGGDEGGRHAAEESGSPTSYRHAVAVGCRPGGRPAVCAECW